MRVLVEVAAVAPRQFRTIALPLSGMLVFSFLMTVALFMPSRKQGAKMPEQKNPAELKAALIFGALYALVLLAVAVAKGHFGSAGLYVVAVISGLTDLDAITLSTGQLADSKTIDTVTAWRVILIAVMSTFSSSSAPSPRSDLRPSRAGSDALSPPFLSQEEQLTVLAELGDCFAEGPVVRQQFIPVSLQRLAC